MKFLVFLLFPTLLFSQNDCQTAAIICENSTIIGNSAGFSIQELNSSNRGCILPNEVVINGFANEHKNLITMYSDRIDNYVIEFSTDCINWQKLVNVNSIDFIYEHNAENLITYYRANNGVNISEVIAVENKNYQRLRILKTYDILGKEISNDFNGLKVVKLSNGTYKIIK